MKAIEQAISLLQNRIDEYVLEKECVNDRIAGLQNAIAVLNNGAEEEPFDSVAHARNLIEHPGPAKESVKIVDPIRDWATRYKGMKTLQAIQAVLAENKSPLHLNDIVARMIEGGFEVPHRKVLYNRLKTVFSCHPEIFYTPKAYSGIYGLKEWELSEKTFDF